MTEEVVQESIAPEILKEAESQGWVPKEKFRGNETDWVDADVFVKRGREILPILRKNNENLMRELNHTKEQLKEFREAAEEFKKFQKDSYERKVAEYETRLAEIKASRAQAINDGDGQKVNALDEALDTVKEEIKEAKQAVKEAAKPVSDPVPSSIDPALQVWLDKNKWFGNDRRLTAIANGVGESLRLEQPTLKGQEFLDRLDEILKEEMPDKFGGETKKKASGSPVESGAGRASRSGGSSRSYDNLPPEAKAACDRFVKQKLMTKEQYVAEYDWE
jgi:hypothetical protein